MEFREADIGDYFETHDMTAKLSNSQNGSPTCRQKSANCGRMDDHNDLARLSNAYSFTQQDPKPEGKANRS